MSHFSQAADVNSGSLQASPPEPIGPFVEFRREGVEQSLSSLFEQQVDRCGAKLALRQGPCSLSYDELNRRSNRIAHTLLERLGDKEEPVALLFAESVKTIEAIFGALKAGKIYAPIDPGMPRSRAAYIVKDSEARVIVTDQTNAALARELCDKSVSVIAVEDLPSTASEQNPTISVGPDRLASLYYTSGSTGQPKGVPLNHRGRLVTHRGYTNALRISSADRLALLYSCAFAGSVNNLYGALLNGASLFPFDVKTEGIAGLAAWLDDEQVTVYHSVPTVFRGLVETLEGRRLPELRVVVLASDAVYEKDVREFRKCFSSGCRLGNAWGVSEAAFNRPYWVDTTRQLPSGMVPAIGPPGEEEEVLLFDDSGQEVRSGQVGEIVLRSRYLTPGYWRKPGLTRKVFENTGTMRLYRTGDLGRRLRDGSVIHLGRKDFQVQIRGNRVELEEVEAALRGVPGVRECAVTAAERDDGEKHLVGHVALDPGKDADGPAIRRLVRNQIPDYMTPTEFVFHETLPVTSGGKIDRKALRDVKPVASRKHPHRPARDRKEAELVRIWEKVLRAASVGIDDNFFDLGGDSLLAARLLALIGRRFRAELPPAVLFEAPTIRQLALLIQHNGHADEIRALVPLQPDGSNYPIFCTHSYDGDVWLYNRLARHLHPDQPVYGLQAIGADGKTPPFEHVEDMAAHYIKEMRKIQPEGPYHLGGTCFGAYIALEMAQQLVASGQRVALLASFDTYGYGEEPPPRLSPPQRVRAYLSRIDRRRPRQALKQALRPLADRLRRANNAVTIRFCQLCLRLGGRLSEDLRRFYLFAIFQRARREYVPRQYPGRVTVLTGAGSGKDPERFWSTIAAETQCRVVPGDHSTILKEPDVKHLAEALREAIETREAGSRQRRTAAAGA